MTFPGLRFGLVTVVGDAHPIGLEIGSVAPGLAELIILAVVA